MKGVSAAAIVVAASAVLSPYLGAQAPTPPATAAAASAAPAPVPANAKARARTGASVPADARVCLEFPTNMQVIKCSEKYRHMKAPT